MAGKTSRAKCPNRAAAIVQPETAKDPDEKPLRPGQCRAHMRKTLAKEFREIVDGFVKEAKSGSCQHVKLATELLGSQRKPNRTPKSTGTLNRWLEEVRRPE